MYVTSRAVTSMQGISDLEVFSLDTDCTDLLCTQTPSPFVDFIYHILFVLISTRCQVLSFMLICPSQQIPAQSARNPQRFGSLPAIGSDYVLTAIKTTLWLV